ncbi:MAG: AAA family ATPase [Myxococcota bacterium]|nr:AAA family ATPase [Myxococcota bacterium]
MPVGLRPRRPLVGRADLMERLEQPLVQPQPGLRWLHLCGEPGIGKTRLLEEVDLRARERGWLVCWTGPAPNRALMPYGMVRALTTSLLGCRQEDLGRYADAGYLDDPVARAGVRELVQPRGLRGLDRAPTAAVARALAVLTRVAVAASGARGLVWLADDIHHCDAPSLHVASWLRSVVERESVVLVSASSGSTPPEAEEVPVPAFNLEEAQAFLASGADGSLPGASDENARNRIPASRGRQRLLPLYLEQIEALGAVDETLPPRLSDAVIARVERLAVDARRLLQTLAVVGDRCPRAWLDEDLYQGMPSAALAALQRAGFVRQEGDEVAFQNPFVRDVVEASIPAQVRRELHERVLSLVIDRGLPVEVRVEHAVRAGDPMRALLMLEQVGDAARRAGDAAGAVNAYRRAVELARRELLESAEPAFEGAIVSFSRKLGDALAEMGDAVGADGVLREALDLTGPLSTERVAVLAALAAVASRRERQRDALRMLGRALELAATLGEPAAELGVQAVLSDVRRREGDLVGAANALARTVELAEAARVAPWQTARWLVDLGETLLELGDGGEARRRLEDALRLLGDDPAGDALAARALSVLGAAAEIEGAHDAAVTLYREALARALRAGDVDGARNYQKAAEAFGRAS